MNRLPFSAPKLALALVLGAAFTLAAARCFKPPAFEGPYLCDPAPAPPCGDDPTLVCDQGICCRLGQEPECPSYVLDGGVCPDGSPARAYYADQDRDRFGDDNTRRLLCGPPAPDGGLVLESGDCNDNPAANGASVYPGAQELCDGLDNDCDGEIDEGLPLRRTWYLDQDQDGHGDPDNYVLSCFAPDGGYVAMGDDCAPTDPSLYPGAPCSVPNTSGICRVSTLVCANGSPSCPQTVSPRPTETCDGFDDNCNGLVDDQPGCGGPSRLDLDPNVQFGVKHLAVPYNGQPTGCVKGAAGASPADALDTNGMIWTGSGPESHVWYAEARSGTWDLSLPTTKLHLTFAFSISSSNTGNRWNAHNQPVVLLCGPAGYIRLVPTSTLIGWTSSSGSVDTFVDVHGATGSNWVVGSGSTQPLDSVLKQVQRVEVLIQPQGTCGTCAAPSFSLDFDKSRTGFVTQ